jgi:hypothetical protein
VGHVAGIGRDHLGMGRRHFAGVGTYDNDLCPYYSAYTSPYDCNYDY